MAMRNCIVIRLEAPLFKL